MMIGLQMGLIKGAVGLIPTVDKTLITVDKITPTVDKTSITVDIFLLTVNKLISLCSLIKNWPESKHLLERIR